MLWRMLWFRVQDKIFQHYKCHLVCPALERAQSYPVQMHLLVDATNGVGCTRIVLINVQMCNGDVNSHTTDVHLCRPQL